METENNQTGQYIDQALALTRVVSNSDAQFVIRADEPDNSGASHNYTIAQRRSDSPATGRITAITFQQGPIGEVGVNGIRSEHLLKIVIDQLEGFQRGPLSNRENALAITKIQEAIHWLNHRTFDRVARGVEGTNQA